MRFSFFLLAAVSYLLSFGCQSETETAAADLPAAETDEMAQGIYDPELAAQIGADDYGMKKYVIAFLKAGPNRDRSEEEAKALQQAHMDNINRMAESGELIAAGPFLDDGPLRGLYIFNVSTVEEAEKLTATDPAIQAGSLVMELIPWYGPAALMLMEDWHDRVTKTTM